MSFLRFRQIPHPQTLMKPIIFPCKSIHFALHTEVNFKCHFCDSAKSLAPNDTWNLSFSLGNPYILRFFHVQKVVFASNMIPLQCGGHLRKDNLIDWLKRRRKEEKEGRREDGMHLKREPTHLRVVGKKRRFTKKQKHKAQYTGLSKIKRLSDSWFLWRVLVVIRRATGPDFDNIFEVPKIIQKVLQYVRGP